MFVDEIEFTVRGGKGGSGCVSFLREKFAMRGGPNGGDGGDGGDLVILPTTHCNTLFHLTGRTLFAAPNGEQGYAKKCGGKNAEDLAIEVPEGTIVYDAERGNVLKDLAKANESFIVARGGLGGRGNSHFATATHRSPRESEPGQDGEVRRVRLSLKLIADVGLLGLPNAGKSTLLSKLTRARPKIADYPFTTLEPMLGIAQGMGDSTFVIADIPGLIAGAHLGKGLGDKFLKHVERTRLLLHLVDCGDLALQTPAEACTIIRAELEGYSQELAKRPQLIVATKVEDEVSAARAAELEQQSGESVIRISSATGNGLRDLIIAVSQFLLVARATPNRD
ncbi:MAG: GTPase ObgE [Planctomycetota bacterium]|jgi:GTP-binding protein|nr:GTPase ObgE [Planctomycetota bacterium]